MLDVAGPDNVKSSTTDPHRPKDFLDPTEIKLFLDAAKTADAPETPTKRAYFASEEAERMLCARCGRVKLQSRGAASKQAEVPGNTAHSWAFVTACGRAVRTRLKLIFQCGASGGRERTMLRLHEIVAAHPLLQARSRSRARGSERAISAALFRYDHAKA
jgi:hypothetical protein